MAKKGDIKHVNYMYRWRKAKKVLREISGGKCMCETQLKDGTWVLLYVDACPHCVAFSFLENYRYNEKK